MPKHSRLERDRQHRARGLRQQLHRLRLRLQQPGDIELIMKATGEPGWHFIDLYPGIYKGSETRPNNFRIPQLTYAADHPGEDLPAFRYAFEVTSGSAVGQ